MEMKSLWLVRRFRFSFTSQESAKRQTMPSWYFWFFSTLLSAILRDTFCSYEWLPCSISLWCRGVLMAQSLCETAILWVNMGLVETRTGVILYK